MTEPATPRIWQVRRILRRVLSAIGMLLLSYGLFLLLGFVPTRVGYETPADADAVRIFVRSNEIHTDLVLPVRDVQSGIDWNETFPPDDFLRDVRSDKWVSIGWGNRQFYVETPTWAEFKLGTAGQALFWPSDSVLHVEYLTEAAPAADMRSVLISREKYRELVTFVETSIDKRDANGIAQTASTVTYGSSDRFYESSGRYHAFNTCNQWTGRGLARASVPVGIWTPLKAHVHCWLPIEAPLTTQP